MSEYVGSGYVVVPVLKDPRNGPSETEYETVPVMIVEQNGERIGKYTVRGEKRTIDPSRVLSERPDDPKEHVELQ
jgi:hypothetical protein